MFENALAQFWEHNDRYCAENARVITDSSNNGLAACSRHAVRCFATNSRLEKCASLLSRKDLPAVQRRYLQLEVCIPCVLLCGCPCHWHASCVQEGTPSRCP